MENVDKDLECIMNTGYFKLVIKSKRISYVSEMDDGEPDENKSEVLLYYEPSTESRHKSHVYQKRGTMNGLMILLENWDS